MLPFTIAQSNARIAIYPVVGDNGFSFPSTLLNSIGNREQLTAALDEFVDYYDGSAGQVLIK
jgi:hypothetical protein